MLDKTICEPHGRLRCSECAYVDELKETIEGLKGEVEQYKELANKSWEDGIFKLTKENDQLRQQLERYREELEDHKSAIYMIQLHNGKIDAYYEIEKIIKELRQELSHD